MKFTEKYSFLSLSIAISSALLITACSKNEPKINQTAVDTPAVESSETNQFPEKQPYLTRDIQDEVFYFVMPDRFHNANPGNDNGDPNRPISYGGLDKTSKWAFHGGDIQGLEAKLDYIENLGVTSIWLTPILRNRAVQADGFGHHGYWVVDFTEIDPHFGSNDDLKSLIDAAHKRDIKIFFDIITNHTADVIKYEECHDKDGKFLEEDQKGCEFISSEDLANGKKYTPFVLESEKDVKVPAWLNDPKYYNNQGDSFWQGESAVKGDFVGLDDIDTSQDEVIEGLTEIFKDLITEFKPDGFRIDTVKHVDIEFWEAFGPAIIKHAQSIGLPEFFIFGEVYDGNPAVLSKFTTQGKLPSVLDFSFAFNVRDVAFAGKSVNQLSHLFDNDDYYRDHDSSPNDLLNFLGNHDLGRVGNAIEQGVITQEIPDISEDEQLARSKLAHALMYMSRGVPVVYYGDEQGFTGDGGDVDARENMDPSLVDVYNDNNLIGTTKTTADDNFDQNHPLYQELANLAALRLEHEGLKSGVHINRIVDDEKQIYGFSRILPESRYDHLALFNFSNDTQQMSMGMGRVSYNKIGGGESNTIETSGDQMMLTLAPASFILLKSDNAIDKSRVQSIRMTPPYQENDRVFIPFELEFENPEQMNFAQIKVYDISVEGESKLLSFDTTAPYRSVLLPDASTNISKIEVHADNFDGQSIKQTFNISLP